MPLVKQHLWVPYHAAEMFTLVDDVLAYPLFLPWCTHASEYERCEESVRASLTLCFAGWDKTFHTLNLRHPHKMLEIRLIEGPFEHLEGFWLFHESDQEPGTRIDFQLSFEFSHSWITPLFSAVFSRATQDLVQAFHQRAQTVYGPRP